MKSALSVLTLVFTALLATGGDPVVNSKSAVQGAKPGTPACSSCSLAPCRCGYSPSYYTHYRGPLRNAGRMPAPVVPHWSRPLARRTTSTWTRSVTPSPRIPRVVPARTPRVTLGYAPSRSHSHHRSRTGTGTVPSRTSTLVPTPRRPRVVPSPTPKKSLGYDPSVSWAHGGVIRRTRR